MSDTQDLANYLKTLSQSEMEHIDAQYAISADLPMGWFGSPITEVARILRGRGVSLACLREMFGDEDENEDALGPCSCGLPATKVLPDCNVACDACTADYLREVLPSAVSSLGADRVRETLTSHGIEFPEK